MTDSNDIDLRFSAMTFDAVSTFVLTMAAGVMVIMIVRRITAWQSAG
ncbi:hypothetical protein [Actinosynnema sp. ALI-1.44]|nr:hypothetical protein [Actinosynnema sp. ALI-1.44]